MKKIITLALSLSSVVLIGAAVGSTPASAGVFCSTAPASHICPSRYPDGTAFKAENTTKILLKMGFAEYECGKSSLAGTIKGEGTQHHTVALSSFTMQECHSPQGLATTETVNPNYWAFPWAEGTNNSTEGFGYTEWKITSMGTTCWYYLPGLAKSKGVSLIGGSPATIEINSNVSKEAGGFLCASPAQMTGRYTVTSPSPLFVEKE